MGRKKRRQKRRKEKEEGGQWVQLFLSIARVKHTDQKQLKEEKVSFSLQVTEHHGKKSGHLCNTYELTELVAARVRSTQVQIRQIPRVEKRKWTLPTKKLGAIDTH